MKRFEFEKFPILATVLAVVGLVLAVVAVATSLLDDLYFLEGIAFLGLLEVVATVLLIAGLTTGRTILLRVISIIVTVASLVAIFILAIVKYELRDVALFAISLLMLIGSVLELVYFFSLKNLRIRKIYMITSLVVGGLIVLYACFYAIEDIYNTVNYGEPLHIRNYLILLSFASISVIQMVIYRSLNPVKEETLENTEAN